MNRLPVKRRSRSRVGPALVTGVVLIAGVAVPAGGAAGAPPENPCPSVLPVREVTAGLAGTGLTVSRGKVPERFGAVVLGVLNDGIAPGVPMIIAETESSAIDRVGGIWAGMSGSPVYAPDGRLIGAVAYGLAFGPSKIAGITPAEEMVKLLRDPVRVATPPRRQVALTKPLRRLLQRTGAISAQQAASGLERLPVPFTVSGLTDSRLAKFAGKMPAGTRVVRGAGVAAGVRADPSQIRPGGNLAAAISLGDVTAAGVGTTTLVCDGEAVGFGHPMIFSGRSSLSANAADAITVQDESLGAPYKLANIEGVVGRIDEDRRVGIRARLGAGPTATPVTSTVADTDSGRSRDGMTAVQDRGWANIIAPMHLLDNLDQVLDRIGAGRSRVAWTATGTAGGAPWALTRTNRFAARAGDSDIAADSVEELSAHLDTLQSGRFTPVTITSVRIDAQADDRYLHYTINKVEVKNTAGKWVVLRPGQPITAKAGAKLEGRAHLVAYAGLAAPRTVGFTLAVPRNRAGTEGTLGISGGLDCGDGDEQPTVACDAGPDPTSFAQLVTSLRNAPRNDQVRAALVFGESATVVARAASAASDVVTGGLEVPVRVKR